MEFGVSANDATPIEAGHWVFLVGQAEPWIAADDLTTGCVLHKQNLAAKRILQDKYEYPHFHVHPQAGAGPLSVGGTQSSGFKGSIAHLAIWNRLLSQDEIASIRARRRRIESDANVSQLCMTAGGRRFAMGAARLG